MRKKIEIYTDGSCLGNPGPGGWGVIILQEKSDIKLSGSEAHTTNNRMEMMAIIKALEWLHENLNKGELAGIRVTIYSDSNLLMGTLNQGWKRKANTDLWAQIDKLRAWLNIEWTWVKAHATNKKNNQVDKLALAAATKAKNALPKNDY
ncbi:ribonuclease HI [Candidatus Peregrinibacteria bacterium]|nr:ribonuclease HI [Candidatus Peregrinibacteria bacterium]